MSEREEQIRQGPLRVVWLKDSYYVVGEGHFLQVDSYPEGEQLLAEIRVRREEL